jgi:glycosyltransferase domain-containing protein
VSDYTLLVPTLNRPALLARLMRFLAGVRLGYPILVLDSSDPVEMASNEAAIRATSLDITHLPLDPSLPFYAKILRGTDAVDTPYVSLCADDDLVFPAAISEALAFLRARPDYHVAQGYYFGFREPAAAVAVAAVIYATPSIDHDSPLARLYATIRHYQPTFYGVALTETLRRSLDRIGRVDGFVFKELLQACETAVLGKVARIPTIYCGRQLGNEFADSGNPRNFTGHPVHWCLAEPRRFFASYAIYRNMLVESLAAAGPLARPRPEIERALDLLHLRYLIADPTLVFRQAEAVLDEADPAPAEEDSAERPAASDVNGIMVTTAASRQFGRCYHLSPAFVKAMAPVRGARPLLSRSEVLATLRMLDHYQ